MPKTKKFADLIAPMMEDDAWRAEVDQIRAGMREVMRLEEIRRRHGLTQTQVARELGVSQHRISQLEHATNPYLDSIREYVEALGGELRITAVFPDKDVDLEIPVKTA